MSAQLDAGKKHLAANRLDEAEACFRALVGSDRELGDAYYGLGLIQLRRKDMHAAWENFTYAVDAEAGNINALLRLADMAVSAGDKQMAISLYSGVLAHNPDVSRAISAIVELAGPSMGSAGHRAGSVERGGVASRGAPPKPPAPSRASGPAYPRQSQNSLVGVVRNFKGDVAPWRGGMGSIVLWHFRLETYDKNGHARPPIGVEMKGNDISGYLRDGDWVEIDKHPRPGRTLKPKRLHNLSDGSHVKATWRMFQGGGG